MKAVLALLLGVAFGNPYSQLRYETAWKEEITYDWENLDHFKAFKNWQTEFGKSYTDLAEEAHRFLVFLDNWKMINDHNVAGDRSFTMKLNQFGDLTGEEFKYYVHGHDGSCVKRRTVQDRVVMVEETLNVNAPTSIDWTNYNGASYVTPVKNQGQCGSCWAFSTTGSIESRSAIKNSQTGSSIVSLSEQQLVDCSGAYGNEGCNGGLMDDAFKYVEASGGLCTEAAYPYTATDGTCKSTTCGTKYDPITSYSDVTADSETSLQNAVAEGPVSIAIEADQSAFQFYSGGILDGLCGTRLDHGVLAVGYGSESGSDYWKVKNSWGTSWGMEGYVLICRNCNKNGNEGECGILMEPSYPKV
jgi:C1A family cysteine protease